MSTKIRLDWTHNGKVAQLCLTSPQDLNAMDDAMALAFRKAYTELAVSSPRVVVVSGEGRAFSAGGNLDMLRAKANQDWEANRQAMLEFYKAFLCLRQLDVPLVCCLHGHVVGAGFCFAAACDIRIADKSAQFAVPFTRLGLHPGMGGSFFLPRTLGRGVATDLILTGRRMSAEEAWTVGFLSKLRPVGELEHARDSVIDSILAGAPEATRAYVHYRRELDRIELEEALGKEAEEQASCYARPEFLEGLEAVALKRQPPWV